VPVPRLAVLGLSLALVGAAGPAAAQTDDRGTPRSITPPLTPAITEIEAAWKPDARIRLRAEVVPRGAEVVKVVFRYRGERFTAKNSRSWTYVRRVEARGGDARGDEVHFKVRACTATRCVTRSTRDDVG